MSALKVPAIIASSSICLVVGVALGTAGAIWFGLTADSVRFGTGKEDADAAKGDKKGPSADEVKAKGMQAFKGGMGGKGGGMFGKPPSARAQLNNLIAKLDVLTQKPLTVTFDNEQRKKVSELLHGLGELEQLSDDDAKKRLDGLLEVVKDQKEPLAMAGFRWPGEKGGGFGPPRDVPNPFKEEAGARHLQSLEKRLERP